MSKFDGIRASTIGIHFLVSTLFGYYFGTWLDKWFGTDQVFALIGAFLGVAAGFLNLFREVQILNAADEAEARRAMEKLEAAERDSDDPPPGADKGNDS